MKIDIISQIDRFQKQGFLTFSVAIKQSQNIEYSSKQPDWQTVKYFETKWLLKDILDQYSFE